MAEIEKHRKKPAEVEMMLWDGSEKSARAIKNWVGAVQVEVGRPGQRETMDGHAAFVFDRSSPEAGLWVAHNGSWSPLPLGYRVAKELDGSGFYPLSPEGFEAGYVTSAVSE